MRAAEVHALAMEFARRVNELHIEALKSPLDREIEFQIADEARAFAARLLSQKGGVR